MSVSIRTRLLLLVILVLLPGVLAALWLIWQSWQDEQHTLERHLRDSTRALSMVVDEELAQRAVIGRVLSLSGMLDSAPQIPPAQLELFQQQARRAMQGMEGWIELRSASGELFNTRPPRKSPAPAAADADASVGARASAPLPPPLAELPTIGPLQPASGGGPLHAAITQPVQRGGRTLLNLTVTILPQELQPIIDQQNLPPGWVAAVIDGHGIVVARQPGGARYAGQMATPELLQRLRTQREAMFESTTLDGHSVVAYFSTSPQGWTYITGVPRGALAGIWTRAFLPAAGAALLLLLGIASALRVARRIADPVTALKDSAAAVRTGALLLPRKPSGLAECDAVMDSLIDAAESTREAREQLQRQVDAAIARTREAEQRVSQGQRIEALGRLTGGVAHDFNNLLGVISNSAHLIDRQACDESVRVPVAAILRSVDVGSRLTQHLLRFAGRQPLRPQNIDLALYLREAQELLRAVLGKRIEFELSIELATPRLTIDAAELELALINLALNARDAIQQGGRVWLRAGRAEAEDLAGLPPRGEGYVLLAFSDDGRGIEEGLAERAFEPFFTTKPVGKGTGLGLSQVLGFCVQAGGSARLASTPGLGTTVSLLLPAGGPTAPVQPPRPPVETRDSMAGVRVLLVEDNDELGRITAALLVSFGCQVERARVPQEALRLFEEAGPFDIVLSDVVMPGGMDGLALARRLREGQPGLPVVLISGFSSALTEGTEFLVLQKPCTPAQLLSALQRTIAAAAADR